MYKTIKKKKKKKKEFSSGSNDYRSQPLAPFTVRTTTKMLGEKYMYTVFFIDLMVSSVSNPIYLFLHTGSRRRSTCAGT